MSRESPYKISLGPKILGRARVILGSLLLFLTIVAVAGAYQGIVSGDFDRAVLKPFREFAADYEKSLQPSPIPTFPPLIIISPSPTPAPVMKYAPVQQTQPVVPNCIRKNIREGEFASNKCYSQQDYEDLEYYLGRYSSAQFDLRSAEGFMKIDCGAAQTFEEKKADCEQDQKDKSGAEAEVEKYKGIIHGIIAKGK